MLQEQKYGVEIEMTGITRYKAAQIISKHFGDTRLLHEGGYYDKFLALDRKQRNWTVMSDGSINTSGGRDTSVEVVTPILGYDDLEDLQQIARDLKASGATSDVKHGCGIHVHVGSEGHTPASIRRMLKFMVGRQDLIYEALEVGGRERWCHKISASIIHAMKSYKDNLDRNAIEGIWYSRANDGYEPRCECQTEHYNPTRYHGINLHSYFQSNNFEFRLFNGTLHAGRIKAYVQFCLAISEWAKTSSDVMGFKSSSSYSPAGKVKLMNEVLTNRLGLKGAEFKTCRYFMTKALVEKAATTSQSVA